MLLQKVRATGLEIGCSAETRDCQYKGVTALCVLGSINSLRTQSGWSRPRGDELPPVGKLDLAELLAHDSDFFIVFGSGEHAAHFLET